MTLGRFMLPACAAIVVILAGCGSDDCLSGSTNCGGTCVNLAEDDLNCGACGTACNFGCFGGTCKALYGQFVQLDGSMPVAGDFLIGSAISVSRPGSLLAFGIIAPPTPAGHQIQMALYADAGGNPGALVASTPATTLTGGRQEVTVSPTSLTSGRYWLMWLYNTVTDVYVPSPTPGYDTSKYVNLTFGSPLPATLPAPTTVPGGPFNQYIVTTD